MLSAAALLAAPTGCGSDPSGETSHPGVDPVAHLADRPTHDAGDHDAATTRRKKKAAAPTTTSTGGSAPCTISDAYQDFKYTGLDCAAAVALATAWDQNGKTCNTIDNPNSPLGFNRTCSVEGFSCRAKRDVHSDARFVSCTQGGQSVRFTWLPA